MAFITLSFTTEMYRSAYQDIVASASISGSSRSKRPLPGSATARTTIHRSASNSSDDRRQSLKLTVKAPPSKLREVMRANEVESLQDTLGGGQVIDGPRRRRVAAAAPRTSGRAPRSKYAEFEEDDIDDDDEEEDADGERDDELGAEPEEGSEDEDEDVEMPDAPMPPKAPKITLKPPAKSAQKPISNPKLVVTPANVGPVKSVEDQEMEDDPGDEEVDDTSELSNDSDEEDEEDDENEDETELPTLNQEAPVAEDEDAPGEEEELEPDDGEDDSDDSSDSTPDSGAATPDMTKLTKRQRGRPEDSEGLMALDMAPQQRKVSVTFIGVKALLTPTVLYRCRESHEERRACSKAQGAYETQDPRRENRCSESLSVYHLQWIDAQLT
jgi:Ino eighty subunit 2